MALVLTMAVATTAVGIEMLEALAIVLAVGVERGRSAYGRAAPAQLLL